MKISNPKIVLSAFVIGILLAISPLALYTVNVVPNTATYFESNVVYENFAGLTELRAFRPPVSSNGSVELQENLSGEGYEYWVIGSDESNHSMATWKIFTWNFPFLKEEINRMNSCLLIDGLVPTAPVQFVSTKIDQVAWRDDNFTAGWYLTSWSEPWSAVTSTSDGYITFTGNLTSQRDYYRLSKNLPTKLSTNDYSYLITRYKSSDGVAYIGAWDEDISIEGTYARYSGEEWSTVFLELPREKNISRVEIGFDDAIPSRYASYASGKQSVSFDFIMIASAKIMGPHVKIFLNNYLVRDIELSTLAPTEYLPSHKDVYTVNASNYVQAVHSLRSWHTQTFKIPIDENLLIGDDSVRIDLAGHISWALSSISIKHEMHYDSPMWMQYSSYIFLFFGIELFIAFMLLRKLYTWFKNI